MDTPRCNMALTRTKRLAVIAIVVIIAVYSFAIVRVYSDRHLIKPQGDQRENLVGDYEVMTETTLQVPEVFRSTQLRIAAAGDGTMRAIDNRGNTLSLSRGADGLYFSQDFNPAGPWILPGIARNWNEGRLRQSGDRVIVEGYMLEKGLMLFVFPFKDVSEWRIELKVKYEAAG